MLSRGEDIVPLVGARRRDRLAEALGALELHLTDDDLQTIEAAVPATAPPATATPQPRWRMLDSGAVSALTREEILDAAEEVLRRYGPAKANVVDVARALDVSHGSVYRHFPSKAALRDAVTERWLESVAEPLDDITDAREWFDTLIATKRSRAQQDPELFATYVNLANESGDVITRHVDHLIHSLARIVGDRTTARAMILATARFHDPKHAAEWTAPEIDEDFESVWVLLDQAIARPASSAHSSAAR